MWVHIWNWYKIKFLYDFKTWGKVHVFPILCKCRIHVSIYHFVALTHSTIEATKSTKDRFKPKKTKKPNFKFDPQILNQKTNNGRNKTWKSHPKSLNAARIKILISSVDQFNDEQEKAICLLIENMIKVLIDNEINR